MSWCVQRRTVPGYREEETRLTVITLASPSPAPRRAPRGVVVHGGGSRRRLIVGRRRVANRDPRTYGKEIEVFGVVVDKC